MARTYKDSGIPWISEIPQGWKVTPIKREFKIIAGATPKTDNMEYWDGNIPWITPADYKTENRTVRIGRRNLTEAGVSSCATTILPAGSIIFSKRAPIGSVAISEVQLCTNQGCFGCIPQKINSVYAFYCLSAFTEQFEQYGSGTTFKEISATNFANFLLPIPQLDEQQRIAEFLDRKCEEIDELIGLQGEFIEELKAYKQSLITETVTRGLNHNAKLKPSGIDWIGDIPETWEIVPLRYACEFRNGYTPSKDHPEFWTDGTIPWYRMEDIRLKGRKLKDAEQYITPEAVKGGGLFDAGSFILATTATIGEHALLIADSLANQQFTNLKIRESLTCKLTVGFFFYYLFVIDNYCKDITFTSTFPSVSMEELKKFVALIPPLSEQQQIADYLDNKCSEIDSLIAIKQQKIEELKDYKKSIIYEYVTGKREIK